MRMTDEDKRQIELAISAVERQSEGEIVLLVAPSSHFYGWVHGLWALTGWIVTSAVLLLLTKLHGVPLTYEHFVFFQLFGANVMALASFVPRLKRFTISKKGRAAAVLHAARANFFTNETSPAAGRARRVYLYLSFFENLAVIDGDAALRAKMKTDYWQGLSKEVSNAMQGEVWMVTLLRVIAKLGDLLEETNPRPLPDEESAPPNQLFN